MKIFRIISLLTLIIAFFIFAPLKEEVSLNFFNIKNTEVKPKIIKSDSTLINTNKEDKEDNDLEDDVDYEVEPGLLVKRIIDGDTFVLEDNRKVRMIGINTPEKNQFFGKEATARTTDLLLDREVYLEFDIDKEDDYGRLLAYVYSENHFINQKLVEEGYAKLMTIKPNVKYLSKLKESYLKAKDSKVGIWAK